jgi:hypothetical protein
MQVIIDRFEGDFAVCEKPGRTMMNIPRNKLPAGAKEGDVLIIEGTSIRIDAAETAKRQKAAEDSLKDLLKH